MNIGLLFGHKFEFQFEIMAPCPGLQYSHHPYHAATLHGLHMHLAVQFAEKESQRWWSVDSSQS